MVFCITMANAQQDPLYSQYFNNPMLINPAFAGNLERLYAGLAYRSQWTGIDGTPVTYNFNSHLSLVDNKVGLGVIAVQDKLGDIKNTSYGMTYSYRISGVKSTFAFGLQGGFTNYATNSEAILVKNNPDPAFASFNETQFNLGAGVLYQHDRYTLSFSVPRLLPGRVQGNGEPLELYAQNFYLYGAYDFILSDRILFKPSTLLRTTPGSSMAVDLTTSVVIDRKYTAGILTRGFNTYGGLIQLVMGNYRAGYVFEIPGKKSALYYNTHELSISISLDVLADHNHDSYGF